MKMKLKTIASTSILAILASTSQIALAEEETSSETAAEVSNVAEADTVAEEAVEGALEANMDNLKLLSDSEDYQAAYDMGQEMLFEHEGEAAFDQLYGSAALEVGKSREAVFTFERLSSEDPENSRYKLDLGRGYYQIGETEKAKALFQDVLLSDDSLPENVVSNITAYLAQIESGSGLDNAGKKESLRGFLGLAMGYDSNANSATDASSISFAYFAEDTFRYVADYDLTDASTEMSASYFARQLGAIYSKPLAKTLDLDFTVYGMHTNNSGDANAFDLGNIFADVTTRYKVSDKARFSAGLRYSGVTSGHEDLYNQTDFALAWSQLINAKYVDYIRASFNTGTIRYEENEALDINPTRLGLTANRQVNKWVHSGMIFTGSDSSEGQHVTTSPAGAVLIDAEYNARSYSGINYGISYLYDAKVKLTGGLLYQVSSYDEEHPEYTDGLGNGLKRDSNLTSLSAGASYAHNKQLQFKLNVSSSENDSDIDIYSYSKEKFELGLSYQL